MFLPKVRRAQKVASYIMQDRRNFTCTNVSWTKKNSSRNYKSTLYFSFDLTTLRVQYRSLVPVGIFKQVGLLGKVKYSREIYVKHET
jgi:hypothetical protein